MPQDINALCKRNAAIPAPPLSDEDTIVKSAEICAYYCKGRFGGKTEIVYTPRKFVKKPSKSNPGFCTYTEYKSISVMPNNHEELKKSE